MSVVLLFYKLLGAWLQLAREREREKRRNVFVHPLACSCCMSLFVRVSGPIVLALAVEDMEIVVSVSDRGISSVTGVVGQIWVVHVSYLARGCAIGGVPSPLPTWVACHTRVM
jgi:hypothetical protein